MARYCRLRSFKVIEAGTNQQPVCNFLSVVHSKFLGNTFHCFRGTATKTPEIGVFTTHP